MSDPFPFAGLLRRLISMLYECLLLGALLLLAVAAFMLIDRSPNDGPMRYVFQLYLLAVCGAYFVWCWTRTGQTLAMKTWRLQVVGNDGHPPGKRQALLRFVAAVPSVGVFGVGLLWALVDRDRQFLHDRLAGTRVVLSPKS